MSQVMQELLAALSQPIRLSTGVEVGVSVSIGVACQPTHGFDGPGLVRAADEALYHVKRNGKQAFAVALAS
ncbi:diguanylate cyclase domain-containing protein [Roseateles saccharophilus]|uniref:Diguanylate cyclase (GGDEF)-like protein n=1 Tax=Roseateles saccharophilus TaxID=304 RepID=A0A4R3VDW5_ROSSA|nr:diguanylate cyclase [Roseateles saccharophilus]MDG0832274.1 diguanylate cyclase [Roseateles saccharophilus]TCV02351.1 diguanylate cyclase (GGDEF)-like protein [Roseateles saccharophilus]